MATRQERMRDRMRGAGTHHVGDVDFGFIIPVADEPANEPEDPSAIESSLPSLPSPPPPAPVPTTTRPTPNTSAKRKHLYRDASRMSPPPAHPVAMPDTRTKRASEQATLRRPSPEQAEDEDEPMEEAPPLPVPAQEQPQSRHATRGPLSSVISATKRLSIEPTSSSSPPSRRGRSRRVPPPPQHQQHQHEPQLQEEEVAESPADAPGSGRRRPVAVSAGTPVVGSSALLQKVLEDLDGDSTQQAMMDGMPSSSPTERRVATRSAARRRSAEVSSAGSAGLSGRGTRSSARLSGGSGSSAVEGDGETTSLGVVEEAEEEGVDGLVAQLGGGQAPVQEEEADGEQEEAQEVGDKEAAQRLGRGRSRRNQPVGSPELNSGLTVGSPTLKRRRRREPASPAQQQQPAKRPRRSKSPPKPQPQPQPQPQPREKPKPKPKPKPKSGTKKQAKAKRKPPNEEGAEEGESWSVPVTVQRFTKQPRGGDEANGEDGQDAEIPFANRGGVNAVDVLSKLCEELVEAYMAKLEERARAAEDAATRREQKTMYRALEAFQEELRTRLLEHTIALDTLHALRKRVRAAQKEKLALRDEILRVRAERDQVALRMDAIRIRHEAESEEALRHISLSSAMHDIDLAVEKGQAAPELSTPERKKADLANLELLISRVADQACSRSDGGGALRQIKEFNAFLERAAAALEGR